MTTKFHCPRCHVAVASAAPCPDCGGAVAVVPRKMNPRQVAVGLAADAVCGVAKAGWKAVKFAVPVALTVVGRAAKAAAPAVKDVAKAPLKKPDSGVVYAGVRGLIRNFFGF